MDHKLIVLEGIDNVGKTTCSERLVNRLIEEGEFAIRLKTPPEQFGELTSIINNGMPTDLHFMYHCTMVKYAEQQAMQLLEEASVVCDRWFYSTCAYHYAAGSELPLHWDNLMSRKPDHVFLLVVTDERVRIERALQKGETAEVHDLQSKDEQPLLARAEAVLMQADLEMVDTTHLTLDEVVETILRMVLL